MKSSLVFLSLFVSFSAALGGSLESGLEHSLALERAAQVENLSYSLYFKIPEKPEAKLRGETEIRFSFTSDAEFIILDFKAEEGSVKEVTSNSLAQKIEFREQHLVVHGMRKGQNTIKVVYESSPPSLNRTSDYLYSLFVPDRASQAFPCFDQPDLKAKFTLELEVAKTWMAVANEKEKNSEAKGEYTLHRFFTTVPMSTYLFAFAAGKFKKRTAERDGREMNLFYRESDEVKVEKNARDLFDLHARSLKFLQSYTSIPYPYSKFDFVLLPAFQFSGMEHPGAIFYKEKALFLDPTADTYAVLARANTIAHETAHQWFGDLVTMKWFEDVWLKEVMANFFAAKIVDPIFPQFNHRLKFYLQHAPAAYAIDRSEGANAIHQELKNLQDAGSLYGSIIYLKAPMVVNQLETIMGASSFQAGIREYLKKYQFSNASWSDLIGILNRHSKNSLTEWARSWVEEAGRPEIKWLPQKKKIEVLQEDPAKKNRLWIQKFQLQGGSSKTSEKRVTKTVELKTKSTSISGTNLSREKTPFLLLNSDAMGYGFFRLDESSKTYLLAHVNELEDPLVRAVAWTALWDEFYETRKNAHELELAAFEAITSEKDELIAGYVSSQFMILYWQFMSDEERLKISEKWETALWAKVMSSSRKELRTLYWWEFTSLAISPKAVEQLKTVWKREAKIPGLPLSEADELKLTTALALRLPQDAESMLKQEETRIQDADRREEFKFMKPALSPDEKVRREFFYSLKDPANRKKEPWVENAVLALSSRVRTSKTFPVEEMVQPALEWLTDIQRTNNIFFPERFIRAVLNGQSNKTAAETVRAFLKVHPDYPHDLRLKILQAADLLFRSTR